MRARISRCATPNRLAELELSTTEQVKEVAMATTMRRILTRLTRLNWVSRLAAPRRADLVVAAADIGDGRAAEEFADVAAAWRQLAETLYAEVGQVYRAAADDLEARADLLRAIPRIRSLLTHQRELAVSPDAVAVERATEQGPDVLLALDCEDLMPLLRALRTWCTIVDQGRLALRVSPGGPCCLRLTGTLYGCTIHLTATSPDPNTWTLLAPADADDVPPRPARGRGHRPARPPGRHARLTTNSTSGY
jgi:hypothetical protein